MDPGGTDAGACSRMAPCRKFVYALTQTSGLRNHMLMATGGYVESTVVISSQTTSAAVLYVHGRGATFTQAGEANVMTISVPIHLRDLEFYAPGSNGIQIVATEILVERVKVHGGYRAFVLNGAATLREIELDTCTYCITVSGGQLTLDRATIKLSDGISALSSIQNISLNVTNLLVFGAAQLALDIPSASGTIAFSTIADSGASTPGTTGPRAVSCGSSLTIRSSIIWAPGTTSRVPVQGCNLVSTIAGPTTTPGAMNTNPMFVDSANRDYHLAPGSPARDAVDTGPPIDFEGTARPQGARFDIGADEAGP